MGDVFLKLLNMSITACWLILAVLCVRVIFRKIPKWANCLLWGVVAIRLIFPFSIESVFSLQPSAQLIQSSAIVGGEVLPYVPSVDSDLSFVENTVNPILAETFAYQESESAAPLQVITGIAGIVWMCGMIIMLIFAIGSMLRLYFQVREAVCYKDNVFLCDAVKSPFILGVVRPRVYLSSALSEKEIEYIIAHEKAHLKRKDHLWKPLGYLLLSVYWFNPFCWVAYIMLCKDIELACDEKVIRDMSFEDKKEYSRVLLSCATQRQLVIACPLAFGEVGVKERVKTILHYKKPAFWVTIVAIAVCAVLAVCFLTDPTEKNAESDNSIYGSIVAGLGDNDTYAFLVMDYDHNVMLSSDLIYDEGTEQQAAVYCDVYYYVDDEAKQLGTIMSDGTAYPITFTKDGIFAASGHKIEKYVISDERFLSLEKGVYEQFDEAGNAKYTSMTGEQESEATEQEYLEMVNEYGRSQIVHFSYGAEDSVNEYHGTEEVPDGQESEGDWITEEINVETSDVTQDGVADYIVTSMRYDPSYVDANASLQDRIAQQIMYDVVSVQVYEGQNGADTYREENLLWSQDYSRVHVGNGQLSIVQVEGKDYLLTSSLYGGQGSATWNYEVFSLKGTGEKEVIDEQSVEFEMGAGDAAESYEAFQAALNHYINNGMLIVACDVDFEEQLIRTWENPYIPQNYYEHAFTKFDDMESGSEAQSHPEGIIEEGVKEVGTALQMAKEVVSQKYANLQEDGYVNWKIDSLTEEYSYDFGGDGAGVRVTVYQLDYAFWAEDTGNVTLAGGMTMDEEGWVVPEYPGSTYLCMVADGGALSYVVLTENDCFPGDEVFTEDLMQVLGISTTEEDYYSVATSLSASEVEEFALGIKRMS